MGADGHITIYDYKKIADEIGEDSIKKLIDSTVYIQELEGKKYLTFYYGDNLIYRGDSWEDRFGWCGDKSKAQDWYLSRDEFTRLWEIVRKYRITSWEVWT